MPRALWWPYGGGLFLVSEVPLDPQNITKVSSQWLVRLCASQHSGVGRHSEFSVQGSGFGVQEFKSSRVLHSEFSIHNSAFSIQRSAFNSSGFRVQEWRVLVSGLGAVPGRTGPGPTMNRKLNMKNSGRISFQRTLCGQWTTSSLSNSLSLSLHRCLPLSLALSLALSLFLSLSLPLSLYLSLSVCVSLSVSLRPGRKASEQKTAGRRSPRRTGQFPSLYLVQMLSSAEE